MKKIILVGAILSTVLASAQQGIGTNLPDKSSALELRSTKRGLLIPRVPLQATNVKNPVASPANSLLVYNTETAGAAGNKVTPGYYYWDDTAKLWIRLVNDADLATVATEAATKSKETVSGTGVVKVVGSGNVDDPNRNFAVSIEPAGDTETKVLKSTNGTVAWEDVPAAGGGNLQTMVTKVKTTNSGPLPSDAWGANADDPNGVYLVVLRVGFVGVVNLPNPADFENRTIALQNISASPRSFSANAPVNIGSIGANRAMQLVSDGSSWYVAAGL